MTKLLIIPEDRLREILDDAIQGAIDQVLADGAKIDVPVPQAPTEIVAPVNLSRRPAPSRQDTKAKYRIGRKDGEYSYADVFADLVTDSPFEFNPWWKRLSRKIATESPRARGSARRSLDQDKRFARVPGRAAIWYDRVDLQQLDLDRE